jgi:NTE family protein
MRWRASATSSRRTAIRLARAAAALLLAALAGAGCNAPGDVAAERLPRFVPPPAGFAPRVALVLGSGGPRGFAHIGVLKVLEENGIRPDLVVGSSVGAMVGAMYADGTGAAQLEALARELNVVEFMELRMLDGGLASGAAIQQFVNARIGGKPIEALRTPFVAAATRVSDGKLALFNHGDTGLAVRASSASPGQFEAVRVGGEYYVDGDEAAPVPIRAARALGARVVIAVDVSAYASDTPPGVPVEWVTKDARRARQVSKEAPQADVLLHPNIGYYAGYKEEYRRRVIAAAESYARWELPAIRAAFERAGIPIPPAQTASTARSPAGEASR